MSKNPPPRSANVRPRVAVIPVLTLLLITLAGYFIASPARVQAVSPDIVISQVYGGGGNSGATYTHDFIELFNRGAAAVSLSGWSVQYASATGSSWAVTSLTNVSLQPGQYYLIQQAQGAGGSTALPTPDASGSTQMGATAGKVALVNDATQLTGTCPSGTNIVDFVGFGTTANCSETAPTPAPSNTNAVLRAANGCTDTDNNSADFTSGAPTPRNTSSPLNPCTGPPSLSIDDVSVFEGDSGATDAIFTISLSSPAPPGGVTFNIATADNTATTADNDYVAKNLTGQTILQGQQTYSFTVTVNGDTNIEPNETFFVNVTGVTGAGLGKGQGIGTIQNDDFAPTEVVISQVYGGGGNAGATYTHDFIELFNRGAFAVDLTGWSVQYISAAGTSWQVTALSGSIAPGGYYLVQQAAGAGGTTALPTPDAVGAIPMSATAGKVALRNTAAVLSGACPVDATVIDLVGFGAANCFEGAGATAALTNTTAALRKRGGCFDSNNNNVDFATGAPLPRNSASPVNDCTPIALTINQIQGSGATTPYAGQTVSTSGIVTARKNNGFFLQTPDANADSDPATSEAIFIFTSSAPPVAVGDAATVTGTATEFFNLTQLESTLPGDVMVVSSGNPLPAPVVLTTTILDPAGPPDQLERFECMRVHADTLVSVAPTNNFGEIFTVLPGVPRPMREPGIGASLTAPPDPTSGVVDCCIPRWDENPERIMVDTDGLAGSTVISVTSNVTLSGITGPLDFTFSNYKVLPETPPATTENISAVPVPLPDPDEFTVAGFNIENFANNPTQLQKASLAIRTVMRYPDVIGHIEILNLLTLESLAVQVNNDAVAAGDPNPHYAAYLIQAPLGGTQNVGFLVKTSRVEVDSVTQERGEETFINPNTGLPDPLHDRPPLVLHATVDPMGINPRPVIIVVNHLRSFIDIELVEGAGPRVRAKRTKQAESLAGLLQELQSANPSTAIISIGDYNAFEFNDGYTDPISIIKGMPTPDDQVVVDESPDLVDPDFVNLTDLLPAEERYTFIFEGTPQALDHVLVNTTAYSYFQRYAIARNNADFPVLPSTLFSGDVTRPERNSDHDMPVAYFRFPPPSADLVVTKAVSSGAVARGSNVTYTVTVKNEGPSPAQNVVITDNLPAGVTFVSCSATGAGACNGTGNNRTVSYTTLAAGASQTVTLVAMVDCAASGGQLIKNTAAVNSATADPDEDNDAQAASFTVEDPAPVISGESVDKPVLGPPNHKMVDVTVSYSAVDECGPVATSLSVASNEPVNGLGDGDTAPDWEVVSPNLVRLRAERSGLGNGRIYTITITAVDAGGNASTKTVTVTVPK
ncbi:MAG: lamin tail domain-containing protein [Blastocatellales bacterium]|nr:lamin tail domain-containing protein [Blastocatellales bacterium]